MTEYPYVIATYLLYLVISISLTIWVARTLHKNGRIFLVHAFSGDESLADSVNHLLKVGFYLINIGYISLSIRELSSKSLGVIEPANLKQMLEYLGYNVGVIMLVLGGMHFFNLLLFYEIKKRSNKKKQQTEKQLPVEPSKVIVVASQE